jgi:hypothetical protein
MGDLFGKYRLDALFMLHWGYLFVRWAFVVISIQINLALHRKEEFSLRRVERAHGDGSFFLMVDVLERRLPPNLGLDK